MLDNGCLDHTRKAKSKHVIRAVVSVGVVSFHNKDKQKAKVR